MTFRSRTWVANCCTPGLEEKSTVQLHAHYRVCGDHFEDKMFMNVNARNSLIHSAVPTVFSFPQSEPMTARQAKGTSPTEETEEVEKMETDTGGMLSVNPFGLVKPSDLVDATAVVNSSDVIKPTDKADASQSDNSVGLMQSSSAAGTPLLPKSVVILQLSNVAVASRLGNSLADECAVLRHQVVDLTKKLEYAKTTLSRVRVTAHRLKKAKLKHQATCNIESSLTKKDSEANCGCKVCSGLKNLSDCQRQFFLSQIRASRYSKLGFRFTTEDKLLALGIYYKSQSAYRFLSNHFRLPSERTLQSFIYERTVEEKSEKNNPCENGDLQSCETGQETAESPGYSDL